MYHDSIQSFYMWCMMSNLLMQIPGILTVWMSLAARHGGV